jgi:hypothetical protein
VLEIYAAIASVAVHSYPSFGMVVVPLTDNLNSLSHDSPLKSCKPRGVDCLKAPKFVDAQKSVCPDVEHRKGLCNMVPKGAPPEVAQGRHQQAEEPFANMSLDKGDASVCFAPRALRSFRSAQLVDRAFC